MGPNFVLDDKGDRDNGLTIGLLVMALALSVVDIWFRLQGFVIHIGPLIVFVVTRSLYKRHFRRQLAALREREEGHR